MRHAVFGKRLGRDINARKALLRNLASALFEKGVITTTLTKAKFAQSYIEKLVTTAKKNSLHSQRALASLVTPQAFIKLTREIAPGFAQRVGGYTRVVKLGARAGDAAPLARLEFVKWSQVKKTAEPPETTTQIPSQPKAKEEAKPSGKKGQRKLIAKKASAKNEKR